MTTQEIETAVSAFLESAGVAVQIHGAGENLDRDGWRCDGWRVQFKRGTQPGQMFDYFTGLGHRAKPTKDAILRAQWAFPGLTAADKAGQTSWGRQYKAHLETLCKPVAPHVAGVLHSLILDAGACRMSFNDWCSDYGYDTDSIEALKTYQACQQGGDKLARVFNDEELETLREMLQDY